MLSNIETLVKLRELILTKPFQAVDCDAIGAKDTWCSWGLCSHVFEQFKIPKRLTCPHRSVGFTRQSCFYQCRYKRNFSKSNSNPDRDVALKRVDSAINALQK